MGGARGLFLPPEHTAEGPAHADTLLAAQVKQAATANQFISLPPALLAPPAPAPGPTMSKHGSKTGRKSTKDGAWDKGVNVKDLSGGIEAKYNGSEAKHGGQAGYKADHGGKAGHKSAKDGARDKGVDGKDLTEGNEAEHGSKAGCEGAKDGARDEGVNGEDQAGGIEADQNSGEAEHGG